MYTVDDGRGKTEATIINLANCTACICEDESKKEDTRVRDLSIIFADKTPDIHIRMPEAKLPEARKAVKDGIAARNLITLSNGHQKTVIVDSTKVLMYKD